MNGEEELDRNELLTEKRADMCEQDSISDLELWATELRRSLERDDLNPRQQLIYEVELQAVEERIAEIRASHDG